jgi:ribosomal protein S18 acetylase RimI-like enzyme
MPAEQAAALGERMPAVLGEYGATMREFRPLLDAAHPTFPHWFLHFLAVRPEAQGRGYGSALLAPMLERADAEQVPAYLDATSEDNKRLYERHNFVVRQVLTLRDSPPLWSMLREAE